MYEKNILLHLELSIPLGYDSRIINYSIKKDNDSNKYLLSMSYFDNNSSLGFNDKIFTNYNDAFDFILNDKYELCRYSIGKIHNDYVNYYKIKLVESCYKITTKYYDKLPFNSFKENLKIDLIMVENAKEKGLKIIKIKNQGKTISFVGKIDVIGSFLSVKNEFGEIIYMTSESDISVNFEEIQDDIYWYFKNLS